MPSDPDVPSGMDPLTIYTFECWEVYPNDTSGTVPEANLVNLNLAIKWSADHGIPIYGSNGDYRIRPTTSDPCVKLLPGARIYCAPGCIISRDAAPASGTPGLVSNTAGSSGAHWVGGGWTPVFRDGAYPVGDVFNLTGDDILLERVGVTGHRGGWAFVMNGERNRIVDPAIVSSKLNAGGVRVTGGSGFRCLDGLVDVTGDAVMISPSAATDDAIADCGVSGTALKSSGGTLVVVETAFGAISNVRVGGVAGVVGATAGAVRVRNVARSSNKSPLSDIVFNSFRVTCDPATTVDTVSIANGVSGTEEPWLTNITFEQFVIVNAAPTGSAPARTLFRVASTGADVTLVSWRDGGVDGAGYSARAISLRGLTGGVFGGLRLDAGTTGSAITVGDGGPCANVVVSDSAVGGVGAGRTAVIFDQAISCGLLRGAVTGAKSDSVGADNAVAVALTAAAHGCFVEGVDLDGIGSDVVSRKIDVSSATDYRLDANHGSAQQTATVGVQTAVALNTTTHAITAPSSFVKVTSSGSATLTTITAGQEGAVLILGTSLSSPDKLTIDKTGNLKLKGSCELASPNDLLMLVGRGANWLEVGRSING